MTAPFPLPETFGEKAKQEAANCPYVLTKKAADCDLAPGTRVICQDVPGLEDSFKGRRHYGVLFGYTKPHSFGAVLDAEGKWWLVHPEAMTESTV